MRHSLTQSGSADQSRSHDRGVGLHVKHLEELAGPRKGRWAFQAEGKAHGKNPETFKGQVHSGGHERPWS